MDNKKCHCFDLPDKLDCFKGNVFLQCFGCCDSNKGNSGDTDTALSFTIIYPNDGTAENPASVTISSRYALDNPFPGYEVACRAEILVDGKWGITGWFSNNTDVTGVLASHLLPDDLIIVQTAMSALFPRNSHASGNPFALTDPSDAAFVAPCRVKVWKLNKFE